MIDENDAVRGPALHGTRGTRRDTPGILAMKTRHKNKRSAWLIIDKFRPYRDNLAGIRTVGQPFVALAGDFAGMAANALLLIL
jgi:hypothetical protein